MQWLIWLVVAAVALAALLALYAGVKGRKQTWALIFGPVRRERVDFESLRLTGSPNQYLVCPPGFCRNAKSHLDAPVFDFSPEQLRERWMQRLASLPLVSRVGADPTNEQYDFEALTPLAHFPDTITVRFLPAEGGRSTLAIYSRSHYGQNDFGANKKRITAWLELLSR
jgi:uncharacterized protein (DUF1499 family)